MAQEIPQRNLSTFELSRADLENELNAVNRKIEVADANENSIERTQRLDSLLDEYGWLTGTLEGLGDSKIEGHEI